MAPPVTCACGICKKCKWRVYMRDYYRRNAQTIRESAKRSRAGRVDSVREYDRARGVWKVRDPLKEAARGKLDKAVRRGRLRRGNCEVCGAANAEGHHEDYARPLDVRWLCRAHHMELHRKVGA